MKLKEYVLSANTGLDAIKRAPIVDYDTGLKCIRIQDISQNKSFEDWGDTLTTSSDYTKFRLCTNDILVARTGATVGVSYIVLKDYNAVFNNGTIRLKLKGNCNPKFIYYVLQTREFMQYIDNVSCVATQPNLRVENLLRFYIPDLSIEKQNSIVNFLSTYDELIENNNKRIKILEQMAENLYKEWFVRFRFPGHESDEHIDSNLGNIPQSFSVLKMKDVISDYIGGGWGNDDEDKDYPVGAFVIRGTDFPNVKKGDLSSCPFRNHKLSNYSARQLRPNDIILEVSGGTAEQPVGRAILVTKEILDRLDNKVICASFCKMIRLNTKIVTPEYFIYWMNYLYETRIIDKFQLQSTGIINFKFEYFLRKGDVLLPSMEVMREFSIKIQDLRKQIDKLSEINDNLIKQRDMLLPRLMSGKLEIKGNQCNVLDFKPKKTFAEFKNEFKAAARKDGGLTEQDLQELYNAYCDDSRDE